MINDLSKQSSVVNMYMAELRDINVQSDSMRFRANIERIGAIMGYEISKKLEYVNKEVTTPLGIAQVPVLREQPVIATILRAGLPLHHGILGVLDKADNAFISAYRKHHSDGTFEISLDYISCPDMENRVVIICDPMLATGASLVKTMQFIKEAGNPSEIHIACALACTVGLEYVQRAEPKATIWCGDIDDELTAKGYIVPGLGDAGDLAYGVKVQM